MKERWDAACQALLLQAKEESVRLEHHFLGTEHVALAMLLKPEGLLARLLAAFETGPGDVEQAILSEVVPSSVIRKHEGFPLSPRIRQVVVECEKMANEEGLSSIEERHLLSALLRGGRGVFVRALERLTLSVPDLLEQYQRAAPIEVDSMASTRASALNPQPQVDPEAATQPGRSGGAKGMDAHDAPTRAGRIDSRDDDEEAPTLPGPTEPKVFKKRVSMAPPDEEPEVADPRPQRAPPPPSPKKWTAAPNAPMMPLGGNPALMHHGVIKAPAVQARTPILNKIGRDLTDLARQGRLGPVVGRDEEIEELTRSLCRASRNNPLLVGDGGVGKTTIIEGLAIDVVQGNVPPSLRGVRIVEIPLATITADTKFRGELEERLMQLVEEAREDNAILVVDDVHALVGAGRSESPVDAAAILKPSLARGEVRVIGTTTPRGLPQMERDSAMLRYFHQIKVDEPTDRCVLEILRDFRERFQSFHNVMVMDEALDAALTLVRTYVKERRMPDVAIDVLDEACVRAVEISSGPKARTSTGKRPVIGAQQVAAVVSARTGIPAEALTIEEKTRMANMESEIRKTVVGQDEAVHRVSERIRMYKAGFREERRPLGVFLFLGPTGVGKTELARAIARFLFSSDEKLLRLDMSEFMEPHEVSKLIGSPPGYVGYGEEGQLTGAVRRDPHCVVLLDEVEKAHPKVFDLFLQVFDDGRLTDGKGVTTDFTHTIIILTSNLGADLWKDKTGIGIRQGGSRGALPPDSDKLREADEAGRRKRMTEALKGTFRAEFLNRLDDVLLFRPLDPEQIRAIARQVIGRWQERAQKQGYRFEVDDEVVAFLCDRGFDPDLGARPMKRAIEQHLIQPLSMKVLEGGLRADAPVVASMQGDEVIFQQED
ncbi:MAG: ATP-dependent Clp protease ATP-binding subunit [Armatimonadetes bacterium]|nr:ATP-dependent Clp protease ATP-binding subunit [Armatimonadota bacterium]